MTLPSAPTHHLRPATPDDLGFQARLYASTREEELNAAQFPDEMREQFLAMQFHAQTTHYTKFHPDAEWLIIECDQATAGRLILDRAEDHFNVMDLALLPEFRGRGIGTILLRQVQAEAATRQLPVRLFADSRDRAIQLYHRLGFVDLSDNGLHTEMVWRPQVET